jgi:hypothetical protein
MVADCLVFFNFRASLQRLLADMILVRMDGGEGMRVQKIYLYEFINRKQRQNQRKGENNEFSNIGGVLYEFSYMQDKLCWFGYHALLLKLPALLLLHK